MISFSVPQAIACDAIYCERDLLSDLTNKGSIDWCIFSLRSSQKNVL